MSQSAHRTGLRKRLAELDTQILHASATFPVLTLPTEITAEFFLCCLPLSDRSGQGVPTETPAPMVLASICRTWRTIALATPALWSKLNVQFDHIPISVVLEPGLVEAFIDQWVSRAEKHPLALDFTSWRDEPFTISRLRTIIHLWSCRVRYLRLDIGDHDIHELRLDSVAFPLPEGVVFASDAQEEATIFANAPQLHELTLESRWITPSIALPLQRLTKFEGSMLDLELFTLAVDLTELKCSFEPREDESFTAVTHLGLKSLTIGRESEEDILQYLTLPALQRLDVSRTGDALAPFLRRSSPPLYAREPGFLDVDDEDMLSILAFLRSPIFDSLGTIRTLGLEYLDDPLDIRDLVRFLYTRSDKICSFRVIWASEPELDRMIFVSPPGVSYLDTVSDHFVRLGQRSVEIYSKIADEKSERPEA
ncbi:hypothetical protein K438DRAFT_1961632 [Mycena galopus ATCC 62051]|nr:hypothetical protein K438DRAFT_1961632 [Mycena galopus ATCC 62051]